MLRKLDERMSVEAAGKAKALAERTPTISGPSVPTDEATVRFVQAGLTELGIRAGGVDGLAGPRTASAIRSYREARKLPSGDGLDEALAGAIRRDLVNG